MIHPVDGPLIFRSGAEDGDEPELALDGPPVQLGDKHLAILQSKKSVFSQISLDGSSANKAVFAFPKAEEAPLVCTLVDSNEHASKKFKKIDVYVSDNQFDEKNWYTITATGGGKSGNFTLLYYGGNFENGSAYGFPVDIPFKKAATLRLLTDSR